MARILSYAVTGVEPMVMGLGPVSAVRLALSRALNARAYLIEQGVRSTRIDARAIGLPEDTGPADRIDILLLAQ